MNSPLLSLLLPYQTCPFINGSYPNLHIEDFLDNLNTILLESERDKIELLIKIDDDDTEAINLIPKIESTYLFYIKCFVSERKQGRESLHDFYNYLFSQTNPNSKFIGFFADDILFHFPKATGLISELEQYQENKYVIFWGVPSSIGDNEVVPLPERLYLEDISLNKVTIFSTPIVSRTILESMINISNLQNIDATMGVLVYFLDRLYSVNIVKLLQKLVTIRKDNLRPDKDNIIYKLNSTFYDIIKLQADNIYLNIKNEGLI